MTKNDVRFIPRSISSEMAREGYNNEGRGELLGYIAQPDKHEKSCRYRISTGGNPDKMPHETCSCSIGLWKENTAATKKVVSRTRKSAKTGKKTKAGKSKPKRRAVRQ